MYTLQRKRKFSFIVIFPCRSVHFSLQRKRKFSVKILMYRFELHYKNIKNALVVTNVMTRIHVARFCTKELLPISHQVRDTRICQNDLNSGIGLKIPLCFTLLSFHTDLIFYCKNLTPVVHCPPLQVKEATISNYIYLSWAVWYLDIVWAPCLDSGHHFNKP